MLLVTLLWAAVVWAFMEFARADRPDRLLRAVVFPTAAYAAVMTALTALAFAREDARP